MIQIENKHKIEDYRFDNYIYNKNDNETLFFLKDYDYDTIENNGKHYRIYHYILKNDTLLMDIQANSIEDIENEKYEPSYGGCGEFISIYYNINNDDIKMKFSNNAKPKAFPHRFEFLKQDENIEQLKKHFKYIIDMTKCDLTKLESYHYYNMNVDTTHIYGCGEHNEKE